MQLIFASVKQAFRKSIAILSLLTLVATSALFIFVAQPSLAASISPDGQKLIQQEQRSKASQAANSANQDVDAAQSESRARAYEEQIQASKNPDKAYENNLKEFAKNNPNSDIVKNAVGEAKEILDKVTGKE